MKKIINDFNPQNFEAKWVAYWEKEGVYKTRAASKEHPKLYTLSMFPYPSGAGLHVGHVRIYTGTDVLARYFRMKGYAVLHPMGWDAFGLPAENAAIKAHKNPMEMVPTNIANFKRQMQALGLSYDWNKEFTTTDPEYYKWTQWLFTFFFKLGLLYKKMTPINFCPKCKTGLAEEEVLADGTHERCGTLIVQKELPQWIFRITSYGDSLLESLKGLEWPRGILEMQKNWIGKKEGVIIEHQVEGMSLKIETFSAYPAWLFADTFIVIAPEHSLVAKLVEGTALEKEVQTFVSETKKITAEERTADKFEKKGVFTGRFALDPFNPGRKMPIWVANFALMNFGTGVIRCSAHDVRDYAFATKYDIPLEEVVERTDSKSPINAHDNTGVLKNSGKFTGRAISLELIEEMVAWIVETKIGKRHVTYHLRDWIFSRQRYWGEPIPAVYCQKCAHNKVSYFETEEGKIFQKDYQNASKMNQTVSETLYGWFPLGEKELPLELPFLKSYEPTDSGESPLAKVTDWKKTQCPHCGGEAERETDTMPNWAGSCWYFLKFAWQANFNDKSTNSQIHKSNSNDKTQNSLLEQFNHLTFNNEFLPVDWYLGGAEHAVLHLLYARFWMHVLNDAGLIAFREPFLRLRNVGMVLAEDHRKMSKSWGNVINPDDVVKTFGADALRLYEMFMAPFDAEIAWSTKSLLGGKRFLKRIYQLYTASAKIAKAGEKESPQLFLELQRTIKKVESDIANVKFNTAISALMEFLNLWEKDDQAVLSVQSAKDYLKLLAPFAPFTAEELWQVVLKEKTSIHTSVWPVAEELENIAAEVNLPVQVNGKMRAVLKLESAKIKDQKYVEEIALKNEKLQKYLGGQKYKLIYVPGKILNFILK